MVTHLKTGCNHGSLGLSDDRIPDSYVTASTELNEDYSASKARLDQGQAWATHVLDPEQWIQVIFYELQRVIGVITQGFVNAWITDFKVEFTNDDDGVWNFILTASDGQPQVSG